MKYKVGNRLFLTLEVEVIDTDEGDSLPYLVDNADFDTPIWVSDSDLTPIKPRETGKVELTKEEADFLDSFEGDVSEALYNIANYGWGYGLLDGNGDPKESLLPSTSFEHKSKLLNALINDYTVANEL